MLQFMDESSTNDMHHNLNRDRNKGILAHHLFQNGAVVSRMVFPQYHVLRFFQQFFRVACHFALLVNNDLGSLEFRFSKYILFFHFVFISIKFL